MIKETALAIAALCMTATPVMAHGRHHHYQRYDHHHRGNGTGTAVAAGLAGLLIGAVVASSQKRQERDVVVVEDRRSTNVCTEDTYVDQYDRTVIRRTCVTQR